MTIVIICSFAAKYKFVPLVLKVKDGKINGSTSTADEVMTI